MSNIRKNNNAVTLLSKYSEKSALKYRVSQAKPQLPPDWRKRLTDKFPELNTLQGATRMNNTFSLHTSDIEITNLIEEVIREQELLGYQVTSIDHYKGYRINTYSDEHGDVVVLAHLGEELLKTESSTGLFPLNIKYPSLTDAMSAIDLVTEKTQLMEYDEFINRITNR